MERGPTSEANSSTDIQEIPRILLNPRVHYLLHNSPSLAHNLSQINVNHAPSNRFLHIRFNIILPSKPR
jgi:cellobiose-specific phosphotransferase system component IIB